MSWASGRHDNKLPFVQLIANAFLFRQLVELFKRQ